MSTSQNDTSKSAEWDAVSQNWDSMAAGYTDSLWKLLEKEPYLSPLLAAPRDQHTTTILDFGCGTGLLTERLVTQAATTVTQCCNIVAVDASPGMMQVLRGKEHIMKGGVDARQLVLGDTSDAATQSFLQQYGGTVDFVIASSVLAFITGDDLKPTMESIGKLLKPETGVLLHTDWPPPAEGKPAAGGVDNPMTDAKAVAMYALGGLVPAKASTIAQFSMGEGHPVVDVFIGVARKP